MLLKRQLCELESLTPHDDSVASDMRYVQRRNAPISLKNNDLRQQVLKSVEAFKRARPEIRWNGQSFFDRGCSLRQLSLEYLARNLGDMKPSSDGIP